MLAPFSQEVLLYAFALTATVLEYLSTAISVGYIDRIHLLQSSCKKLLYQTTLPLWWSVSRLSHIQYFKFLQSLSPSYKKIRLCSTCEMLSVSVSFIIFSTHRIYYVVCVCMSPVIAGSYSSQANVPPNVTVLLL